MPLQFSTVVRNAALDQIQTSVGVSAVLKLFTGSPPANCAAADSGTKLVEFDLASSWASPASGGAKTLANLPLTVAAIAAGIVGYFRIYDSTGSTCHMQGTITQTGGGGDMTCDNTNVANAQNITVGGFNLSCPGA
jgi:hypothetical protein